jgi:hypothetical protein
MDPFITTKPNHKDRKKGIVIIYINIIKHRTDGRKQWYRINGPAVEYVDGHKW